MNNFFKAEFENPFHKKSKPTTNNSNKEINKNNAECSDKDFYNNHKKDQIKLDILEGGDDNVNVYSNDSSIHKNLDKKDISDYFNQTQTKASNKNKNKNKNKNRNVTNLHKTKLNNSQNYLYSVINQLEAKNDEDIYLKELYNNDNSIKCTSKILNTTC